jgi:hypothetical protein
VGKVKAQLLRWLKAFTKDQAVKRMQIQERETQDIRAEREVTGRREQEEDRVDRAIDMSGQLMQDALSRLLPPPDAAPKRDLPDVDEDEDNEVAGNMSEEQDRVEQTLAMSSQHMREAMTGLLTPPDTALQCTFGSG